MRFSVKLAALGTAMTLGLSAMAFGAGHSDNPFAPHVAARQGAMNIMSFNLGILGGMARGNVDYDAEAAATAASNLAAVTMIDGRPMFAPGSDNGALGDVTRALPAIWENPQGFGEAWMGFAAAANGVAAVAGDGLEALQGAMGPLGASCGSCHRNFRQSN